MVLPYTFLFLAIVLEVVGTLFLRDTDGFTKMIPNLIVVFSYAASFYFLITILEKNYGFTLHLSLFSNSFRSCWYSFSKRHRRLHKNDSQPCSCFQLCCKFLFSFANFSAYFSFCSLCNLVGSRNCFNSNFGSNQISRISIFACFFWNTFDRNWRYFSFSQHRKLRYQPILFYIIIMPFEDCSSVTCSF